MSNIIRLIELLNQYITLRNQLSTETVDKPGLDKLKGNGWSRLEVDWLFFAQGDSVTDSRYRKYERDKAGDAIVRRTLSTEPPFCNTYPKTIKPADPRYKEIMGVMEQETGLTASAAFRTVPVE